MGGINGNIIENMKLKKKLSTMIKTMKSDFEKMKLKRN
jgi:hypothetical protein